jgi:hypothetical protein
MVPTAVRGSCMTVTGMSIGVRLLIASSLARHIAPLPFALSASTYWPFIQTMFSLGACFFSMPAPAYSSIWESLGWKIWTGAVR